MILARWRPQPIRERPRERQPVTARLQSIGLKPLLLFFVNEKTTEPKQPTMAFAQIYLTQLRKFCDEEEHAVKAEKLKSNGKIYGEPNSYKMVSQSQIESCLERVQASV